MNRNKKNYKLELSEDEIDELLDGNTLIMPDGLEISGDAELLSCKFPGDSDKGHEISAPTSGRFDEYIDGKYWTLLGAIKKWLYMWNLRRKVRRVYKKMKFKELQIDLEKARQMGFSLPWTYVYLDEDGNVVIKEIPAEDFFKDSDE